MCLLGFSEVIPADRHLKVGKSDSLRFLRKILLSLKLEKRVIFGQKSTLTLL